MDQLSSLLRDYSILTRLSCMSQMVPVKSEYIYIFVCYSASCPLILLHSGRRRGAFLGEVHTPLPIGATSSSASWSMSEETGEPSFPGLPGRVACPPGGQPRSLRQKQNAVSWHGFSHFPVCTGISSVLSVMRAIKKVQVLKRSWTMPIKPLNPWQNQ